MLAIADFADDEGRAFPSITTLAGKVRTVPRYVIKLLDALVASGELEILKNAGPLGRGGRTNLYRVRLENLTAPSSSEGVNSSSPVNAGSPVNPSSESSELGVIEVVTPSSPKPSYNHHDPSIPTAKRRGRQPSERRTFKAWNEDWEQANPNGKLLPESDHLFAYADEIGLSYEFLNLAWHWFKDHHAESSKTQADWRQTFRNYVREDWCRLWCRDAEGFWKLTTKGKQVALRHGFDEKMTSSRRT
jgi:hypothetical protein